MALSRLLLPQTRLHFHTRGLPRPTKWFSSSSNGKNDKSSCLKKSEAAREQKAVAVESYVKKYMEMHPGVFPKATHVQNKVGGSWYTLKGILTNLRNKMHSQFQSHFTNETSDSTVDTRASQATTAHNSPHNTEPQNIFQFSEAVVDSNSNKKVISTSATAQNTDDPKLGEPDSIVQGSETIVGSLDEDNYISTSAPSPIMGKTSSEDNTDLGETESIVQSSEAIMDSQSNEVNISASATSQLMGENSAEDVDQSKDISDRSKLVEPENGHGHHEEAMSGLLGGFDGDQKSEYEHLFSSTCRLLKEASTTLEKDGANKWTSFGNENRQPDEKITTSGPTPNGCSEVGETPASSGSAKKGKGLAHLFMRAMNDQAAIEMVGHANSILTLNSVPKNLNETSVEDIEKMSDIKSLMTCIKKLPREQSINKSQDNIISNKTDQVSRGSTTSIQSRANLPKSGDKGGQSSLKYHAMGMESKKFNYGKEEPSTEVHFMACTKSMGQDGDKSDLDVAVFDHIKLEPSPQVALPTSKEHLKKNPDTYFTKEGSKQNKVLVRFLNKNVKNSDITSALEDCGRIVKIYQVPSKGSNFIDAYIYFKTREGLQKALKKTDLRVRNSDAIVETTSSLEDMPNRISIPNLIGDPDVPVSLVKNPTRTIMIKELTHGISLRHLKEAFSFCESGISRLFLGSSSSVAYVEFKTEDAKEKAIAKHSIDVLGQRLLIFRIDAPRTTVVRMSIKNLQNPLKSVQSILTSYGQVKHIQLRNKDTLDAYFNLAEWPNMLNILNSLNGMKVHGCQLHVQPAPVYPPDILQILWSQPDGRRHVKAVMHNLCQKLEVNPINTTGLTHLLAKHYGEGF